MDNDPHRKWAVFSGLTRREQQVLAFLILAIAAGLAYEHYRSGWRRESLTLHRAEANKGPAVTSATALAAPRGRPQDRATSTTRQSPLDLNQATTEQLEALPGIGPVRAEAIVRYREARGPFRRVEDLKQIAGIGEKTLEGLRPFFRPPANPTTASTATRGGETTPTQEARFPAPPLLATPDRPARVNINTATIEELDTLEGIGPALARRIIEYRQQHGSFRIPSDIQKVPGIGPVVFQKNRDRITVGGLRR